MTVGQIIDEVRADYIKRFETAVAEQRALAGGVLTEVALRDETGALVSEGLLQLPMRLDVVPMTHTGSEPAVSVDSETRIEFDPLELLWGDRLEVTLKPFWWDSLRIELTVTHWERLRRWFMKWFSADRDGNGESLGVVHFLSDPQPVSSRHVLTADLGTAPVEAFEELLEAVEASGATAVVIGGDPVES